MISQRASKSESWSFSSVWDNEFWKLEITVRISVNTMAGRHCPVSVQQSGTTNVRHSLASLQAQTQLPRYLVLRLETKFRGFFEWTLEWAFCDFSNLKGSQSLIGVFTCDRLPFLYECLQRSDRLRSADNRSRVRHPRIELIRLRQPKEEQNNTSD